MVWDRGFVKIPNRMAGIIPERTEARSIILSPSAIMED
jgi:hypothetical protein